MPDENKCEMVVMTREEFRRMLTEAIAAATNRGWQDVRVATDAGFKCVLYSDVAGLLVVNVTKAEDVGKDEEVLRSTGIPYTDRIEHLRWADQNRSW